MITILTGEIASLLIRFGATEPCPNDPNATDVADASVSLTTINRIRSSLTEDRARSWLMSRGFDLSAHCAPEGAAPSPALPLEFIVSAHKNVRRRPGITIRYCPFPLAREQLLAVPPDLDFGDDVYVASPELQLAVMASGQPLSAVIEYGDGLCGSYALAEDCWHTAYQLPVATTAARLTRGVRDLADRLGCPPRERADGRRTGLERCLVAAPYLLDGSASPMESKVAILFTLPMRLGGYGLSGLSLNHRADLTVEQRAIVGKPYLVVDGWFDGPGVGFEYDSVEFHDSLGPDKLDRDRLRGEVLEQAGTTILTLTRDILSHPAATDAFVDDVRRNIGLQPAIPSEWTLRTRRHLRESLSLPRLLQEVRAGKRLR